MAVKIETPKELFEKAADGVKSIKKTVGDDKVPNESFEKAADLIKNIEESIGSVMGQGPISQNLAKLTSTANSILEGNLDVNQTMPSGPKRP